MKEAKVVYYEAKQKQRALHDKVTALKDKNAPAHALLEYVFRFSQLSFFLVASLHGDPFLFFIFHSLMWMVSTDVRISCRTYGKRHKELSKAREDSKKKCAATFKKMTNKWAESDERVCCPL